MPFVNPLTDIYRAYEVAADCFKVSQLAIDGGAADYLRGTQFIGNTPDEAAESVELASSQAADLVIVALWATFERQIIERLQTRGAELSTGHPPGYSERLATRFRNEVERWPLHHILELFQDEIDKELIDRVVQIKRYRDWLAHRNPSKRPRVVDPTTSFNLLSTLLQHLYDVHGDSRDEGGDETPARDPVAPPGLAPA